MESSLQSNSPLARLGYHSLQDEHLAQYFSNPHRRRHLQRMGLITRDGRIVDEPTFQRKAMHRDHYKRQKDTMASTTASRARETEWQLRAKLKRKLEAVIQCEAVRKVKKEKLHPLGVQRYCPRRTDPAPGQASPALGQTSPIPGPVPHSRLSRILETHKDRVTFDPAELREFKHIVKKITGPRMTSPSPPPRPPSTPKPRTPAAESGHATRRRPHTAPSDPAQLKELQHLVEKITGERMMPRPPSTPKPRTPAAIKVVPGHAARRRPRTASTKNGSDTNLLEKTEGTRVTLRFLGLRGTRGRGKGKTQAKKQSRRKGDSQLDLTPTEVVVQQQARGYTPLEVYKEQLLPGKSFSFRSIRCVSMPYALMLYTGGMIDCRVSACCEYRHRKGTLLGGKSAHFRVVAVEGGSPCHRCLTDGEGRNQSRPKKSDQKPTGSTELESQDRKQRPATEQLSPLYLPPHGSSPQLLQGPPSQNDVGESEEEEGQGSPSPVSSQYSASFQSESDEQSSSDEEAPSRAGSEHSLHSLSEKSAILSRVSEAETFDLERSTASKISRATGSKGSCASLSRRASTPLETSEERTKPETVATVHAQDSNSPSQDSPDKEEAGEIEGGNGEAYEGGRISPNRGQEEHDADQPEKLSSSQEERDEASGSSRLLTKGGVRIVYELGPILTSETATQTIDQVNRSTKTESTTQDTNQSPSASQSPTSSTSSLEHVATLSEAREGTESISVVVTNSQSKEVSDDHAEEEKEEVAAMDDRTRMVEPEKEGGNENEAVEHGTSTGLASDHETITSNGEVPSTDKDATRSESPVPSSHVHDETLAAVCPTLLKTTDESTDSRSPEIEKPQEMALIPSDDGDIKDLETEAASSSKPELLNEPEAEETNKASAPIDRPVVSKEATPTITQRNDESPPVDADENASQQKDLSLERENLSNDEADIEQTLPSHGVPKAPSSAHPKQEPATLSDTPQSSSRSMLTARLVSEKELSPSNSTPDSLSTSSQTATPVDKTADETTGKRADETADKTAGKTAEETADKTADEMDAEVQPKRKDSDRESEAEAATHKSGDASLVTAADNRDEQQVSEKEKTSLTEDDFSN